MIAQGPQDKSVRGAARRSFFSSPVNILLIIAFTVLSAALQVAVIMKSTVAHQTVQSVLFLEHEAVKDAITSVFPAIVLLLLLLCVFLLIIYRGREASTSVLFSLGIVFAVSGLTSLLCGWFFSAIAAKFPIVLHDLFAGSETVFSSMLILCSLAWFLTAGILTSTALSFFRSGKVKRHE